MSDTQTRRSFLSLVFTRAAGLWVLATGGALAAASACDIADKYGGPDEPVAKYGGPPEEDGGPSYEGVDAAYGGPCNFLDCDGGTRDAGE